MKLKPFLFRWHSFLGVWLALLIALQLVTGLVIAFRWQLNDWMCASNRPGDRAALSAGQIVDAFEREFPSHTLNRLFFPGGLSSPYLLQATAGKNDLFVAMDTYSAEPIRAGGWGQFPVEAALALHYQPLPGVAGSLLITVTAMTLLLMTTTGLVYAWPTRGRLRSIFQIRWHTRFSVWGRQLHRALGLLLAPLVLLIAITGLLMIMEILLPQLSGSGGSAVSLSSQWQPNGAGIDAAVALAQQRFPGAKPRDILFATDGGLRVQSVEPASHPWAVNRVQLNGRTLTVESVLAAKDNPAMWARLLPLHTGAYWGWPGRLVIVATGAGIVLLLLLGVASWWQKRQRSRR